MADFSFALASPAPQSTNTSVLPTIDQVPGWLLGADNHNLGNTLGGSWFDPASWGDKFSNAGKFMSVSFLSGVNSFYNTAVTVGNWFGSESSMRDNDEWISSIDSDLGEYYAQNRSSADLAGFIAGSFVPGLAGIRVLNAGQKALVAANAGAVGTNMSRVTGILAPQTSNYIKLAKADIAATNASFNLLNQNSLLALRNGTWQNVLEGVAFETAVYATMKQSPILQDQDVGDIVKNIAIGGALSGVIGGAFTTAGIRSQLKRAIGEEDAAAKFATTREQYLESTAPSAKIVMAAAERESRAIPVAIGGDTANPLYLKDRNNYLLTIEKTNNDIRTEVNRMAVAKDTEIGNLVADTLMVAPNRALAGQPGMSSLQVMNNMLHADEIARIGRTTAVERELSAAFKAGNGLDALTRLVTRIVKVTGDEAGKVLDSTPVVRGLADSVAPRAGQSTADAVMQEVKSYGFKSSKLWDPNTLKGDKVHLEAEARYLWWKEYGDGIVQNTKPGKSIVVHTNDIPALEYAFQSGNFGRFMLTDGKVTYRPGSSTELYDHIKQVKEDVANDMLLRMVYEGQIPQAEGTELIARAVNVRKAYLEGTRNLQDEQADIFWRQGQDKRYAAQRVAEGLDTKPGEYNTALIPEYAKISYRIPEEFAGANGHVIDGLTYLKTKEVMDQQVLDRAVAAHMDGMDAGLPTADEITRLLPDANRVGAGPGLVTFAAGNYGTLASAMTQIGSVTQRLKIAKKEAAKEILNAPLVALATNTKAAIEFANISRVVASTSEHYIYVDELAEYGFGQGPGLLARKLAKGAAEEGFEDPKALLQAGAPEAIPITNEVTAAAVQAHVRTNARRVNAERDIWAARGKQNYKDINTFYPVRPNTKDYPYFAFVLDPRVTEVGHKSMIHAASERELNELIKQVQTKAPEYKVITKSQADEFYKAKGEYDFDRSLHENYIDSDLRKKGIASEFFIKTDPQAIADDILNYHMRAEDVSAVELVRTKYQKQFDWLEDQGSQYSTIEASRYGATLERVEATEKNPYMSYLKTALDISRVAEYPLLYSINKRLDEAVSKVVGRVRETFNAAKSPADLDSINSALKEAGYNTAYYDAALNLYANHPAPKGELTKFIRGANAILSRFTLGLDPLNALNNAIGANVLRGTELNYVTKLIQKGGDPQAIGKLAELTKIALPTEQRALVTSPTKLVAQAVKNFLSPERADLVAKYKADGYIRNITEQFRSILDDFTLQGTETVSDLNSKLQVAFQKARDLGDKGETLTGNTLAEEFNRFISANVMGQITDVAVQAGVMSQREAKAYINTFVNRVEGNIIASQRPLIFQGPIGQAIGLFQSYQFNLLQNLFRYAGEGRAKDIATLMGLQGTLYGLNGMPGFAFINQHIVGTASGNTDHKDIYDATYGIAGIEAGKFLLYGAPAYITDSNLYTRGDINPRQVTIIPTQLSEVPIVGAYSKFIGSILDTSSKIRAGGSVTEAALFGLEHNGISRPLAGIAQVLRGTVNDGVYSTSNKANMMMGQNDLLAWSTAVRIAGGKPLDEAVVVDAMYRSLAYKAYDRGRMLQLGEAVKLSVQAGALPSGEQVATFAEKYAERGGKQEQFAAWYMNQYKNANTPQSEQILKQLRDPLAQKVQVLMGGQEEEL